MALHKSKSRIGRAILRIASRWVRLQVDKTKHCRECDAMVRMFDDVCPQCGASEPARVPKSAVTVVLAMTACVITAVMMIVG